MRTRFAQSAAILAFLGLSLLPRPASAANQVLDSVAALSADGATRAAATSGPVIGAAPATLDFGNVAIGQTATRTLTVSNTGDQSLSLSSVLISDPRFTSSFAGPQVISPGSVTSFFVSYHPNGSSFDSATITFLSNALNGALEVQATGSGAPVAGPDLGAGRVLIAPTGESAGDQFGISVASAGDLNGDGLGDVIVGAWTNDAAGFDAGRAYIYFGAATPSDTPALVLQGAAEGDIFGTSVASAGDVNGDGHPDVVVGAWGAIAAGIRTGRAYVYFGGPGMDAVADRTFTGEAGLDRFGKSACSAGDVNGDGYADILVGAFDNDAGGTNAGRAYVYFGGPGADEVADWVLTGVAAFDHFGWSAAGAGDVNGDGFDDIIVGAYQNDAGAADAGRAYVYFGGPTPNNVPDWILTGAEGGEWFGVNVASAGDVNGDGSPDVIVGADLNSSNGLYAGRAYVFYGGPGADTISDKTLTGAHPEGIFGASVASAGDVNGDGYTDLLVGAYGNSATGPLAGSAYLYFGGPGWDEIPDQVYNGEMPGDRLGTMVAAAGDVDGDGHRDIILGAYYNDALADLAGRAYVLTPTTVPAAVVSAPSSVAGTAGSPISFEVTATDPEGGAIHSLTASPLPSGAAFTVNGTYTSGIFTWIPGVLQVGTYSVMFTASNGAIGSATTTIVVSGPNRAPIISAPASVFAAEGAPIAFAVQASDPDGDHAVLGILQRPVGSVFVDYGNNTGNFGWTPNFSQAGPYSISFTARDDRGANAEPGVVAIAVDNVNRGPTAVVGGPYAGVVNVAVAFNGTGSSDPDGDALAYDWSYGDLASGTGPNPLHAYAAGGVYTVTLAVRDESMTALASTTATIQDVFPGSAFLEGGNRTTRLNSGKAETCVQIEPIARSYMNSSVSIASTVMISPGTGSVDRVSAIADKTTIGADRDRNGIDEITACFAKTDLRNLFSGLTAGRHVVGVTLEGELATGGLFRATLEIEVIASGNSLDASVSPNPLNPAGILSFRTTRPGAVKITMFDPAGRLVRTVLSQPFVQAGYHDATIDGRRDDGGRLPSGVYFYQVETVEGTVKGRIVVLK